MDISLPLMESQLSIKKQVEDVLEVTKKKKMHEKNYLGLYEMEIFRNDVGVGDVFGNIKGVR